MLLSFAILFAVPNALALDRPPNFVLILADDLGYGDLGVYGHPLLKTPNLDRMASEGVRLTNFYAAASTCTPSRAALLTGRYPIRSGLIRVLHPREKLGLPDSEITLAEALKERGYATACIGKWHLGDLATYRPNRHGFDYFYGLLYSNDMTVMPPNFSRLSLYRNGSPIESPVIQRTLTQRYTEQAVEFIHETRRRPFFLYLPHTMPHVPLHASKRFRGKSLAGLYGDVVEEIDWSVGEVLKAVKDAGLEEETLVLFTSDNGPALVKGLHGGSPGPLRGGKQTTWEGGVRVPCIARWPGRLPAGVVRHAMATAMDVFPTLVELAGGVVPADRPIDGRNLLAMLEGEEASSHASFYYFGGAQVFAVRLGAWKLHLTKRVLSIKGVGKPQPCQPPELYNLEEDPSERHDLSAKYPEIVAHLSREAREFLTRIEPGALPRPWRWYR
jgi:arylsulfatase A